MADILDRLKRERALQLGLLVAVATAVAQALDSHVSWTAALPVVAGAVIRWFVTPVPVRYPTDAVPPANQPRRTGP